MIYSRVRHEVVSNSKLVIGGQTDNLMWEVFDSITRKFIMMKEPTLYNDIEATLLLVIKF